MNIRTLQGLNQNYSHIERPIYLAHYVPIKHISRIRNV